MASQRERWTPAFARVTGGSTTPSIENGGEIKYDFPANQANVVDYSQDYARLNKDAQKGRAQLVREWKREKEDDGVA